MTRWFIVFWSLAASGQSRQEATVRDEPGAMILRVQAFRPVDALADELGNLGHAAIIVEEPLYRHSGGLMDISKEVSAGG